jgi:hypothetical protein
VVDQTTHPPKCRSFVGLDRQIGSSPPANLRSLEMRKFYICSDVTHTHRLISTFFFVTNPSKDTQEILYDEPTGRLALVFELMDMCHGCLLGASRPFPQI